MTDEFSDEDIVIAVDDGFSIEAAEENDADEALKEAARAQSDKSTEPGHDNFDAGLATLRHAHIDKFGEDPEDASN